MTKTIKLSIFISQLLACALWTGTCSAQGESSYPSRTVRFIIATGAGTTADILARVIADKASVGWRQPVIVENRPGVAGLTGVAKAEPDGHNLLVTANGHAAVGVLHPKYPIDPAKDFVGVAQIGVVPLVLVVPPEYPAQNLKELIALAKAKPGALNFASAGVGSTSHLAGEVFKRTADIDIQHVPYRGVETLTSVMRGDTQMTFVPISTGLDLINTSKVRPIAIANPTRVSVLPDVPTFAEAGLSGFDYRAWFGVLAAAGTPKNSLAEIGRMIERVLGQEDTQAALSKQGIRIEFEGTDRFDATLKSDIQRYDRLLSK